MTSRWRRVFDAGPQDEGRREVLCGLGNGYLGVRGVEPEHAADGIHYPGTYVAGCYNRLADTVDGVDIETESMVNLPNPLVLTLRSGDGDWWGSPGVVVLGSRHELDVRRGMLIRRARIRDGAGRTTAIVQRRFVHLGHRHVVGLQTTVVPEDWSGHLTVRSEIDAATTNSGVRRYRRLGSRHYSAERLTNPYPDVALCVVETNQSCIRIGLATRTTIRDADPVSASMGERPERVGAEMSVRVTAGRSVTIDKLAVIYTSRDRAVSDPADAAVERVRELPDFDALSESHGLAWNQMWRRFRFRFHFPHRSDRIVAAVRFDQFHVLQTVTPHSMDLDVGVPARGLHGEAYRGHVFWDEVFVLRTLCLRTPQVARALMAYRYRRLPAARRAARAAGLRGAMFPWQSGSDGREENQRVHLNPDSGRWVPDHTDLERHVGLAIAYNVWQYWQSTGDRQFLEQSGAELIVEVARFFADLATYDHRKDRYVLRGVVGPDEFHTAYPGADRPGIDNNAYTNVMAVWVLLRAGDALSALPSGRRQELHETLGLRADEERRWDDISRRMYVPIHDDGVISQFEGYENLVELDWDALRQRHGDIRRLDRILGAEGDDPNRYRASKQADALMLFYLLSADELRDIFGRLGYRLTPQAIPRTIDFYLARTSHGSTLSAVVHAWVLARSRRERALEFFVRGLESDVRDVHGGTTAEGVHLGAMAGSVDVLERCFGGLETREGALWLNPYWPAELGEVEFDVTYRGHLLRLRVCGAEVTLRSLDGAAPVEVRCRGECFVVQPGSTVVVPQPDVTPGR